MDLHQAPEESNQTHTLTDIYSRLRNKLSGRKNVHVRMRISYLNKRSHEVSAYVVGE